VEGRLEAVAVARLTNPRRLLVAVLAALALSAASLGCGSSNKGSESATDVTVADFSFTPNVRGISAGQTVTWTNQGQTTHNVKGSGFFSKALDPGQKYSFRFSKPGRFPYLCTLHPTQMRGTVVVKPVG
jgi:plastocyanin